MNSATKHALLIQVKKSVASTEALNIASNLERFIRYWLKSITLQRKQMGFLPPELAVALCSMSNNAKRYNLYSHSQITWKSQYP